LILFSVFLILLDYLPKPKPSITITSVTPKKKKTVTKKPKITPKPKPKVQLANSWGDDIVTDAVDGLVKLGYKRSRSRMIVARLCAKNKYQKPEHIIIDAIKCV
jgi:Holliday junction resolvasome RuvABC DNA-binding subunit